MTKATGDVVWEMELPVTGAPITCLHQGTQYIIVATGGGSDPAEHVAISLPESWERRPSDMQTFERFSD